MSISLESFLTVQGFSAHPFATTDAEREAGVLPSFFVRDTWFDWLAGDPVCPESVILFAPHGYGKTSHRLELARRARERRENPALVITINDFTPLIRPGLDQLTLDIYLALIRRLTLEALEMQLRVSEQQREQLECNPQMAAHYYALLKLFAPRSAIGKTPPPNTDAFIEALRAENLGPKEWLKELAQVVAYVGFASIYCLLDGIDELHETRNNPAQIFRLLAPLLDAPGLLQECNYAFKFFLPLDIRAALKQQGVGRLDRIPDRVLTWSNEHLLTMLSQRLVSFNRSSGTSPLTRVRIFQDLCQADFDVDLYLVQAAAGSPRALVALARAVLEHHCEQATQPEEPISAESIRAAVRGNLAGSASTVEAAMLELPTPQPVRSLEPATPRLYMDGRGDIWLEGRRLEVKLPRLMRQCFDYLWERRSQRVSYDELLVALYGENLDQRGDPRSSLEKLIRRLREALEPGLPSSHNYIETQTGAGYVLRNFRDELP